MPSARPRLVSTLLLLVALVLSPLVAQAQSGDATFGVSAIRRSGDNLTIEVVASRTVASLTVSLFSGGTLVALPEKYYDVFYSGDRKAIEFTLLKDTQSATLSFRWRTQTGGSESQSIGIPVPDREKKAEGAPKLLVSQTTLRGTLLTINATNVGDAPTGRVIFSVEDAQQRKVGSPYYRVIEQVVPGASAQVDFTVASKTEQVTVAMEYAARTERVAVAVRRLAEESASQEAPVNVTLSTDLPFREIDLGRTIDYALAVKNTGRHALVRLDVEGLPEGYSYRFFVGGSAVPSLLIGNQTRTVTLSITVPNAAMEVDKTAELAVVARVNGTEAARLPVGFTVRGVGKLEISGADLLARVPPGGTGRFTVDVRNSGSAPLFDVELEGRRIYGWTFRFEPRRLDRLDPAEVKEVSVEVRAPDVIAPGQYTTDLSARSGDAASRQLAIAMEVTATEESGGWLWFVFLGLIAGTLGVAYWKRRRG